jgi:hypothetical protein
MHDLHAALAAYLRWRRGQRPLERCAADLALGIWVLAIALWVTI